MEPGNLNHSRSGTQKFDIMNNTFDFNRFGKYYVSDLKNTFNNTWLTVLLTSLSGLIAYVFCGLMNLFISGSWGSYELIGRSITFVILLYVLIIIIPAKAYGFFTDKRKGSFYTLIPASAFEKFLSMFINTAILMPLAYFVIALTGDALLCLVDHGCGQPLITAGAEAASEFNEFFGSIADTANFSIFSTGELICGVVINLISWALVFLLGALYFKKNKIGKTILVLIVIEMAFSMVLTPIMMHVGEGLLNWLSELEAENVARTFNSIKWSSYTFGLLVTIGLAIWGYFRVKTVKY